MDRWVGATMALLAVSCGGGGPNGDEADAGRTPDAMSSDSAVIFDDTVVRTYDLTVAQADWEFLNDDPRREQYVPATLEFEGANYTDVAIRYKGAVGSLGLCFDAQGNQICDKLGIKLKFSEYVRDKRFYGLKRINFHAMESDDSKMREAVAYQLFREAGVMAPRTAYARIVVNGELLGLFAVVEAIDGRFTRRVSPDGSGEGNLYKEVWPEHVSEQPYINALKSNRDENPSADKMVRFARAIDAAEAASFESIIEQWTDADMLFNYMAVARLIDHWDGIVAWYCVGDCFNHNYYWYESVTEDKVWLVPWDLDHTFEEPSPVRTYFGMPDWDENTGSCDPIPIFLGITGRPPHCDPLINLMNIGAWDRYVSATQQVLASQFQIAALRSRIEEIAAVIRAAVLEDPYLDEVEWNAGIDALESALVAKRAYIEAKIAP